MLLHDLLHHGEVSGSIGILLDQLLNSAMALILASECLLELVNLLTQLGNLPTWRSLCSAALLNPMLLGDKAIRNVAAIADGLSQQLPDSRAVLLEILDELQGRLGTLTTLAEIANLLGEEHIQPAGVLASFLKLRSTGKALDI